jgi:hypothetical protein
MHTIDFEHNDNIWEVTLNDDYDEILFASFHRQGELINGVRCETRITKVVRITKLIERLIFSHLKQSKLWS